MKCELKNFKPLIIYLVESVKPMSNKIKKNSKLFKKNIFGMYVNEMRLGDILTKDKSEIIIINFANKRKK